MKNSACARHLGMFSSPRWINCTVIIKPKFQIDMKLNCKNRQPNINSINNRHKFSAP